MKERYWYDDRPRDPLSNSPGRETSLTLFRGRPKDPLHLVIRRKRVGRELRRLMYRGAPSTPLPYGRELSWACIVRDFTDRGWFTIQELEEETGRYAVECPLLRLPAYEHESDFALLKSLSDHLYSTCRRQGRFESPWTSQTMARLRQEDFAKQALLDGLCPWCGTWLPCQDHQIGRVRITGHGGLEEYDRPAMRSSPSCGSHVPSAVCPRPRSA